jgi:hypothetical protein
MSTQITTAFVQQYRANVMMLAQQKGSRIRSAVRTESINGKRAFFDQIGSVSARLRTTRHSDTPQMDTPHARRSVVTASYDWADLIDREDRIRLLIDPTSDYARAAAWAMGRSMDDVLIAAMYGTAYTGETASTSTSFDANMKVARDFVISGSAANSGLTIGKLIEAKRLLDAQNLDPDEARYIVVHAKQIRDLLNTTQITSSDYNTVKALVSGQVDTFLGFKFIQLERLPTTTTAGFDANGDRAVFFWQEGALLLGLGAEPEVRISERADKNYATQVFCSMDIGATRMEEARIGTIACVET